MNTALASGQISFWLCSLYNVSEVSSSDNENFHIRFYLTASSLQDKEEDQKLLGIEGPFTMRICLMCQELLPGLAIFCLSWLHFLHV